MPPAWPLRSPLAGDGALGTLLLPGTAPGTPLEALNLTAPEQVRALLRAYRAAGASVVQTNTFGANRLLLSGGAWQDHANAIAAAGVALAREAASGALIAGSLGPLGQPVGWAAAHADAVRRCYGEPLAALAAAGADLLLLETQYDAQEAQQAVSAALQAAAGGLPVACTFAARPDLRLACGCPVERAAAMALEAGAGAVGVNCGDGPATALAAARRIAAAAPGAPLIVQPSAGLPNASGAVWPVSPAAFAEFAAAALDLGAALIGGCCGTTPDHIAALAAVVASQR